LKNYDIAVIGSGHAGAPLALECARAGLATALIDDGLAAGGGPISDAPARALQASARVAQLARRARDFGVETGSVAVDLGKVQQRQHALAEDRRSGIIQALAEAPGLDVFTGKAQFLDARTLQVTPEQGAPVQLRAGKSFINTGTRSARPRLAGMGTVPWLDASSVMEMEDLPSHLLVVEGGHWALELGQMFRRFGSRVSLVEPRERLLPREDRDVAATVAQILREDGIDVFLETEAVAAGPVAGDAVRLLVHTPTGERALQGSHLLVIGGCIPNTEGLGLAAAGVGVDEQGYIRVDERLQTTAEGIYALGEVNGCPPLAHMEHDDLRIARTNLLGGGQATTTGRMCPYTIYIDPPLGRVGLTETEARAQCPSVRVARLPMARVARAVELGETRGFMKVVVDAGSGRILGAAVLGTGGGEVMAMLQIAMMAKMPYAALRDGVFAHPTLAESLNNLFTAMEK
jgi:pyruvate/2-oxoglutarate dehydrogenase complex dihydrolipoamide dehydrogenase (E3) component